MGTKDPVFADVNGDGEKDGLVSLLAEEGNGYSEFTYLWLWDPRSVPPHQVKQPVTDDGRCGNVTTSIKATQNRLTVRFLDRSVLQAAPDVKAPVIATAKTLKLWDAATDQSGVPTGWVKAMYVPRHGRYDLRDPLAAS